MGHIDSLLIVDNARAATALTGNATTVSTDAIDLKTAAELGIGEDLYAVFHVTTTFSGGNITNLVVGIIGSANSNLSSGVQLCRFPDITMYAGADAGETYVLKVSPFTRLFTTGAYTSGGSGVNGYRYLGMAYTTTGTTAPTAGVFSAYFTSTPVDQHRKYYPSGFTVT